MEDTQAVSLLVRRCVAGDAAAWEEIVRSYNRRIYNICYRFSGSPDDAEDLTQEVFIKLYRTLGTWDQSKGAFATWLTSVTRNLLVDHFRKTKQDRATDSLDATPAGDQEAKPLAEQLPDTAPPADARVQTQQAQRMVHDALQEASPRAARGRHPPRLAGHGLSRDSPGPEGPGGHRKVPD